MSTLTIRLPDDLKAQVERVAAARGASAHAFMLEAIAENAGLLVKGAFGSAGGIVTVDVADTGYGMTPAFAELFARE